MGVMRNARKPHCKRLLSNLRTHNKFQWQQLNTLTESRTMDTVFYLPISPQTMPQTSSPILRRGDFICVKADHNDHTRAGLDGMVMDVSDAGIGLYFGLDRSGKAQHVHRVGSGNAQHVYCAGTEMWAVDELDLKTRDTSMPLN